ncbi:MAG: 50S ribosomal protein L19 [Flavobacteriaceae bacterium]|jgi:large subunit ribosomal protein L19|nr:50S ribosomal protein L19 [Flavobacteriaceae bacterium]MDG1912769.1 50S ribosomal protein L19 [Flavobacteriaceae bacterium]
MEALINFVQNEFIEKKEFPKFDAGDTLTVYYQIREGEKVRTQFFKGVVIQIKGQGLSKTFTIRKMSGTVGVERIFPLNLPTLEKIEVNKKGKVRRSRIYYFKELRGKKARIKEARMDS